MTKVLVATEKPFAPAAVDGIRNVCNDAGYELVLLEKYTDPAELINAVTDLNLNAGLLQRIAWRTLTLERLFNIFAGFTSQDDWLPERFYREDIDVEDSAKHCDKEAFSQLHREYYKTMGWDDAGVPKKETLKELDLVQILRDRSVRETLF